MRYIRFIRKSRAVLFENQLQNSLRLKIDITEFHYYQKMGHTKYMGHRIFYSRILISTVRRRRKTLQNRYVFSENVMFDYNTLNYTCINPTSRERPKSAPYLRLKNSKRTSICQSIGELGTLLSFGSFQHPFCRKTAKKLKGGHFGEIFFRKKSLTMPKKTERGDPLVSPGMVCYAGKQENLFSSVH